MTDSANIQFPRNTVFVGACIAAYRNRDRGRAPGPETEDRLSIWFGHPRERWKASRLSFHLNCQAVERRPKEGEANFVLHTCDNKWCINPEHLYLGSKSRNMRDMWERHPEEMFQTWSKAKKGKPKASRSTPYTEEELSKRSASMKRAWSRVAPETRAERRAKLLAVNPKTQQVQPTITGDLT